jgi:cobalt-zinc-cadmium efflux system protein
LASHHHSHPAAEHANEHAHHARGDARSHDGHASGHDGHCHSREGHGHSHDGHRHQHGLPEGVGAALGRSLLIVFVFGLIEILVGVASGSLALVSDGVHMLTDGLALALAWGAQWLSRRAAGPALSFGWGRIEPLAAFTNALFYLVVLVFIVYEAVGRLDDPPAIDPSLALPVAILGLLVNAGVWRILHGGAHQLNTRAALLHVIGDFAGSLIAIVAILTVKYTGSHLIDPLLSLAISVLLLVSTARLLRDSGLVLLNGVPQGIDSGRVGEALKSIEGVVGFHDLHLWSIGESERALAAHVQVSDMGEWPQVLEQARALMRERFAIGHTTLQPEVSGDPCAKAMAECGAGDSPPV